MILIMSDHYVLIDSSGILFHQYYGMKNASDVNKYKLNINNQEVDFSAIVGYFRAFNKVYNEQFDNVPMENIIHILDSDEGSLYRKSLYLEYKKNRQEKDEELIQQINMLEYFLKAKNQKFLRIKNVESDDVIGTLANSLSLNKENKILILSYDKDLFQLLSPNVFILREEKDKQGMKRFCLYSDNYVFKQYGFPPTSIVDFLAIVGDTSDNIPGVKGIGKEGAKKLLSKYITIENILENLDELPIKQKEKILASKQDMILSKKLAIIQTNLKEVPNVEDIDMNLKDNVKKQMLQILNMLGVE